MGGVEVQVGLHEPANLTPKRPADQFLTPPKQAVVYDLHLSAYLDGRIDAGETGVDGKDDASYLFGALDLQALRTVIRNLGDAQVSIEVSDEFIT